MVFPYFTFSIGVTTASAAILGLGMQRKIRQLKSDWKNQRCKPHGMLAAGIPGVRPSGVSASQNYKECQLGIFQYVDYPDNSNYICYNGFIDGHD